MEAVKDEEVNMIGLYGMGGCGKTTLVEEVIKIAEAEHLFDKVLIVTVSSPVKVRRIQARIASSMQYTLEVKEEKERATALCDRLTQENKILVILDDMWQKLDLGAIGIPLPEHHKGCKVLITTRSEDVCTSMDCQKMIQLKILADEEAWVFFQKQARISEDTSENLKNLGREISDECKGLPVAIAAVAGSLKDKNEVIWRTALNRLRNSKPFYIERGLTDPYNSLKLSYDYLDTEEAKSLFLLCSVFPEDYKIPIEDLIKLAIGLGVVGEVRSYDEARSEVIAAKLKLVNSCLLMLDASDDDECVKMHDLVRDVAHFIAKNENKAIKCQLENGLTLEESSIRYLWCNEFPNDLDCSNLEFLRTSTTWEILDENFKRMRTLRVLILHNAARGQRSLSTMSFITLTNLRCLILHNWELSDISFVRYMKRLQSLSLYHCSLPSFLDLQTGSFSLPGLITLSLEICPKLSSLCTESAARTLISLEKVIIKGCDGLKHIITERAQKNEKEDIAEDDHDLQSVISIFPSLKTVDITKCANLEVIFPLSSLSELMSLEIRECKKLKQIMEQDLEEDKYLSNILSSQPPLAKLTKLVVEKCPNLKRVFPTSASIDLSNLEILIINGAAELEELIGCELGKGHEIEKAKVELPKLKLTILLNLPNLCQGIEFLIVKHRIVHNCPKLALTSTTTLQELYEDFPHSDFENAQLSREELHDLIDQINDELDEVLTSRDTIELPSLQISKELEKEFSGEVDGSAVQATTTSRNLELNGMSSPNPLDISQGETNVEISEVVEKEFTGEFDGSVVHATTTSTNLELNGMSSPYPLDISQGETNIEELLGVKGSSSVNGGFGCPALITGHAQAAGVSQYIGEVVPAPAPLQPSNPSPQVDLTSLIARLDQQAAFNREQAEFARHHFHSMGQYLTHQMQDQRQLYTAIQQLTPPEQSQLPPWPDRPTYEDFFQSQWGYPPSGSQ